MNYFRLSAFYFDDCVCYQQVMLVNKQDKIEDWLYTILVVPLLISLLALMLMAFGARGGNPCKYSLPLILQCLIDRQLIQVL